MADRVAFRTIVSVAVFMVSVGAVAVFAQVVWDWNRAAGVAYVACALVGGCWLADVLGRWIGDGRG